MTQQQSSLVHPLKPTTVLQRIPEFSMQLYSNGQVRVMTDRGAVVCGPHTLPILEAFSRPTAFEEVIQLLRPRVKGMQDWIDLTSTIMQLSEAGVLQDSRQIAPVLRATEPGFDAAHIHIKMLNDRARTAGYLAAIREVVRPGDIVVDIGTGTGVLAVAAARAGARHVYAIEASGIGKAAEAVFEANGLAERITLVPGWSTQVSLPEGADVLISEIIGNEPLGEQVLEITADALKRLLNPGARLVPGKISIYGVPVVVPAAMLARHRFTREAQEDWHAWYDIDLSPLCHAVQPSSSYLFFVKPYQVREWTPLSAPVLLAEINLQHVKCPRIDNTATATIHSSGTLNGLIMYCEAELSSKVLLTTDPMQVDEHCSWYTPVWLFADPMTVQVGGSLSVTYTHRTSGQHSSVRAAHA